MKDGVLQQQVLANYMPLRLSAFPSIGGKNLTFYTFSLKTQRVLSQLTESTSDIFYRNPFVTYISH